MDELKELLESKAAQYNQASFIPTDPIQVPHRFSQKGDIEIAAFLTAAIAWGQRTTIINNATRLIELMDGAPHDFILNHGPKNLKPMRAFVHRTFNGSDCIAFMAGLQRIYQEIGGLEEAILNAFKTERENPGSGWENFKNTFFKVPHLARSEKHLPTPRKGSAAKRMNMFLRWMVRDDAHGVDFGIWNTISPAALYLPLDVHTARVARKLGLLERKQNDWKAVVELTDNLKQFDPCDPVRYDFALFGLGAFEKY